jgi:peptide/nickel transport system ATP-binding protein
MPAEDTLVEFKDLHTSFYLAEGVVRAVDGVDLEIKRGKTIGIVGESGCGKSITSLSLMRLVPPPGKIDSGEILYYRTLKNNGSGSMTEVVDIAKLEPNSQEIRHIRGAQISMVFQEPMTAMSPVRTIGAQITEAIMLHQKVDKKEARERAIDMMGKARLPNPQRVIEHPSNCRAGCASVPDRYALGRHPSRIADEPTTALDAPPKRRSDLMRSLLQDLAWASCISLITWA